MSKKSQDLNKQVLDELISQMKKEVGVSSLPTNIPDIITFCNAPEFLNMPNGRHGKVNLFILQTIVLKCFYRGTLGNENLTLTQEEIQHLIDLGLEYVIDKYNSGVLFRELILVFGRRSGKDLLCSLIALYEAMRLLEVPGGNPVAHYNLAPGQPITILTIANSGKQAMILFDEIKNRMLSSTYFNNKVGSIESQDIYLLTPADKIKNEELMKRGLEPEKGSVVITAGHSNSDSLVGKRIFCLALDEVALYRNSSGASSGETIYKNLLPATSDFVVTYMENGVEKKRFDSKIVSISSPRGKDGIFYRLYTESFDEKKGRNRLAFRLPTWRVNLNLSEELLKQENQLMSPEQFAMEFGAEFAGLAGERFLPEEYIEKMINPELKQREVGNPMHVYYLHVDPASTSHNYAMLMLHVEHVTRNIITPEGKTKKESVKKFIVDHIMVWQPTVTHAIDFDKVDEYILKLGKRFRIGMVAYDAYNSGASIQKLRKHGIPAKMTPFRRQFKMLIYRNLESLIITGTVELPGISNWSRMLASELKCLKRKYTSNGFIIEPDKEADTKTNDIADCLAGACTLAMSSESGSLSRGNLIWNPQSDSARQWNIGQASMTDSIWTQWNSKFGKW